MVVTVDELSDAERRVWNAFPAGTLVNFLTGIAGNDDPAGGEHWGEDRQVRAEVLLALLCGAVEVEPGQLGAVNLQGARITSAIKLPEAKFKHPLVLNRCYIGDGIVLPETATRLVALRNCHIGPIDVSNAKINGAFVLAGSHLDGKDGPALLADGLTVTGQMHCDEVTADGPVSLAYASIRGGALRFSGAHLDGKDGPALMADGLTVTGQMHCDEVTADGPVSLAYASIRGGLRFSGAHLDGKDKEALSANGLTVTGSMDCDGVTADGPVSLAYASIEGVFKFSGAHLDGKGKEALFAYRLTVTGDMTCSRVTAVGGINMMNARIDGHLVFSGAHLDGKDEKALFAYKLTVGGDMHCGQSDEDDQGYEAEGDEADKRFRAVGGINMMGARIGGHLTFSGAHLDGTDEEAMLALELDVTGIVLCDRVKADGQVIMQDARIGSGLVFSGAHLDGKDKEALSANRMAVAGDMLCNEDDEGDGAGTRFRAVGGISLAGARIRGGLVFSGAHLDGKDGPALMANGLTVTGQMSCYGITAAGQVYMAGASIGGGLVFSGAHLDGKDKDALSAYSLNVAGSMLCDEDDEDDGTGKNFCADGGISLAGASIGGQLVFSGAHLHGKDGPALSAEGLTVTGMMVCDQKFRADGGISLAGASIGQLQDEKESWPKPEKSLPKPLELDGLTYSGLTDMHVKDRLQWLELSPYRAQPYEQLAAYYQQQGEDRQARRVLLAKQRARRKQHRPLLRGWGWLQDGLVGYGYAPGRALLLLALAFVTGWVVFHSHHPPPVNPVAHPTFNAALYTVDVLVPAPGLGQASDWDPHGAELAVAAGLHILGWLLAITVIAAITRLFSRS